MIHTVSDVDLDIEQITAAFKQYWSKFALRPTHIFVGEASTRMWIRMVYGGRNHRPARGTRAMKRRHHRLHDRHPK